MSKDARLKDLLKRAREMSKVNKEEHIRVVRDTLGKTYLFTNQTIKAMCKSDEIIAEFKKGRKVPKRKKRKAQDGSNSKSYSKDSGK